MDTNKILSANLLDLIFDDRNKDYGAYELRVTYPERVKKALIITISVSALVFTGTVLASSLQPGDETNRVKTELILHEIEMEKDQPKPLPPPERQPEPQVRTVQWTTPIITEEEIDQPPPELDDFDNSKIDLKTQEGLDFNGIVESEDVGQKGIIEEQKNTEPEIFRDVQVHAKFNGNWEKFLLRYLNANVPIDNGAPVGRYKVIIEFVVDKEGKVSDLKAISNAGYGMEQEAIRVLKKSDKWDPAIQNGYPVKAYRQQSIVFEVVDQ
jgi:protein TonB